MKIIMKMYDENDQVRSWTPRNADEIGHAYRSNRRQYYSLPHNRIIRRKTKLKIFERFETWLIYHIRSTVPPDLRNGDPQLGWINNIHLNTLQTTVEQICSDRIHSIIPKDDEDPDAPAGGGKRKWIAPIMTALAFVYCIVALSIAGGGG